MGLGGSSSAVISGGGPHSLDKKQPFLSYTPALSVASSGETEAGSAGEHPAKG
jgi:hypothetical protein